MRGPTVPDPPTRWRAVALASLCLMFGHSPASAIHFALVGDGSSQSLTWLSSPSCVNYTEGVIWATEGRIFQSGGATLDWTGEGALQVVAYHPIYFTNPLLRPCSDNWLAIEAREVPLVFQVQADPGDPLPLVMDLSIAPAIAGTYDMRGGIAGNPGSVTLTLQMTMTVTVNGQWVSGDSLSEVRTVSDGQTTLWSPAFPNGAANQATIPGITAGSLVEIRLWFYHRTHFSDCVSIFGSGPYPYTYGAAIVIDAQPYNVVGVGESQANDLWIGVRPNPSPGTARIHFSLPRASPVRLAVYDVAGSRVATLVDRVEEAGRGELAWDGRDSRGQRLAPGVYMVELLAGAERRVGRLVLLGR